MALETCNETLCSLEKVGASVSKVANFDYYPKRKGSSSIVFKGVMNSSEGTERAAVKTMRKEKGSPKNLSMYLTIATMVHEMLQQFLSGYKNVIDFTECHMALMDKVSSFNAVFRAVKKYDKVIKKDEYVIFEPYLSGHFETFVGKDGLVFGDCPATLEEFCHYSFHASRGEYLICGLQGVKTDDKYHLTTPRIQSRVRGTYGWNDLGEEGLRNFFKTHRCTPKCRKWRKPSEKADLVDFFSKDPEMLIGSYSKNAMTDSPPPYWSVVSENKSTQVKLQSQNVIEYVVNKKQSMLL